MKVHFLPSGTVTSPRGFRAGATVAGIKKKAQALDLGILFADAPCAVAGVFTTNLIKAAPVLLCQQRMKAGRARAVVVNSGCANASTGEAGLADAHQTAELTSRALGVSPEEVLVASTGVIGHRLPMDKVKAGIGRIALSADSGHEFARAIMTTDTVPKTAAVKVEDSPCVIGGASKGAGMIHPSLATLLGFLATDAAVDSVFLRQALRRAADISFNMISVDGDTSTNDTILLLANGLAGNQPIREGSPLAQAFQESLEQLCIHLAKSIARDGEGATKLLEVTVKGARTEADARLAARTIVSSSLVKTAVYGNDPNWGRVIAAAGRSGIELAETKLDLYLGSIGLVKAGQPLPFDLDAAIKALDKKEVSFILNLNLGKASATAWGCDLSEEYVKINSQYTT